MSDSQIVDEAIASRRSLRAFHPTAIPQEEIETILKVAARTPSGTNMQPWKVYVTTGETKERLSQAVLSAFNDPEYKPEQTYKYYPTPFFEPYLTRRRTVGWDLYSRLGIEKGDGARMHAQHGENYRFFGAPVGLMFTMDKRLEIGSWLDYGMFLQNVMTAARARGLDTCPQAAWPPFAPVIRKVLDIPEGETIVCGMALGWKDGTKIENTLVPEREPVEAFTTFLE